MQDVIILDGGFSPMLPVVDVYSSLQWTRKYYECGDFELHAPIAFCDVLRNGKYVHRGDAEETGMIEEFGYDLNSGGEESVYVKGRFLNALLENRVADTMKTVRGSAEVVMRTLVDAYAINPADSARRIEKLEMGALKGIGAYVEAQLQGEDLHTYFEQLCAEQELSFLVRYDFYGDKLIFDVWQGKDRSDTQTENSMAVFSREFENISSESYVLNLEKYKNFAYVAGGEDDAPVIETVSVMAAGEERREMYVDAGNVKQKDDSGDPISEADYRALLRQRGLEKLKEQGAAESVDTEIHPYGNLAYKKDFDLGDLCIVQNPRIGYQAAQRITEVKETYENGSARIDAVFGTEKMTIKKYIDRRTKNV